MSPALLGPSLPPRGVFRAGLRGGGASTEEQSRSEGERGCESVSGCHVSSRLKPVVLGCGPVRYSIHAVGDRSLHDATTVGGPPGARRASPRFETYRHGPGSVLRDEKQGPSSCAPPLRDARVAPLHSTGGCPHEPSSRNDRRPAAVGGSRANEGRAAWLDSGRAGAPRHPQSSRATAAGKNRPPTARPLQRTPENARAPERVGKPQEPGPRCASSTAHE